MKRGVPIPILFLALLYLWAAGTRADDRAPSPEEQRALLERVIANQHRDDAALEQYERTERRRVRKSKQDAAPSADRTLRVVPTGTANFRVPVEENGRPVDAALYRAGLGALERALTAAVNPPDAKQRQAAEKHAKRSRERAEAVDAVRDAFHFTWAGRENLEGRTVAKFTFEPNPAFKSKSRTTALFAYVRGTAWVDEASGHLARLEAEIVRDIPFGGGIVAKVYRGGRFALEQAEVAPGVWLPTRYEYDFAGRKFLFGFAMHELTLASNYRRIGPPREALLVIRRELNGSTAARSDP